MDIVGDEAFSGKPVGQDLLHNRPNAAVPLGLSGAVAKLDNLIAEAQRSLPLCHGRDDMRALIAKLANRLCPPRVRELTAGPMITATAVVALAP
jgi:geranylgeranyl diphosphate synthase type II